MCIIREMYLYLTRILGIFLSYFWKKNNQATKKLSKYSCKFIIILSSEEMHLIKWCLFFILFLGVSLSEAPGCLDPWPGASSGTVWEVGHHRPPPNHFLDVRLHIPHGLPHGCAPDLCSLEQRKLMFTTSVYKLIPYHYFQHCF